jgi:hypothetical protein
VHAAKANKARRENKVPQARKALKAIKGYLAPRESLDRRASKALQDL